MARIALENFAEKEVARIYIAAELGEAKRVENTLTQNGIDYAVEIEPYVRYNLGSLENKGAAFYVISGQADFCRRALREAGLKAGIVDGPLS
ncbi:MAG: hypothetical protein ACREQA_00425 [Candidatus Binatia bacterium]